MKSEQGVARFETYLSTQSPAPRQNTRLSHSHEYSGRSQCLTAPPSEGPSSHHSLKSSFDLSSFPQDFPAATPKRVSAGLRRRATPERATMHGLPPLQRTTTDPAGDYRTGTHRQCGIAQSLEAAGTRGVPLEPPEASGRLGYSSEPPRAGGAGPFCDPGAGTAAIVPETSSARSPLGGLMKFFALGLIRFYQGCISPTLPLACRYYPSCSAYAYEAVETWGVWRGTRLAMGRLLRCRPWGPHGYDPVPQRQGLGARG
jgi:uncharacterized protein